MGCRGGGYAALVGIQWERCGRREHSLCFSRYWCGSQALLTSVLEWLGQSCKPNLKQCSGEGYEDILYWEVFSNPPPWKQQCRDLGLHTLMHMKEPSLAFTHQNLLKPSKYPCLLISGLQSDTLETVFSTEQNKVLRWRGGNCKSWVECQKNSGRKSKFFVLFVFHGGGRFAIQMVVILK